MGLIIEGSISQAQANASSLPALLGRTRSALRERRLAAASRSAATILRSGSGLKNLARIFAGAQQIDLLVQLTWERRKIALRRLSAIAIFMQLCDCLEDREIRIRWLRSWLFDERTPPASFSIQDEFHQPIHFAGRILRPEDIGHQRLLDLFLIKYRGWKDRPFEENVAALARRCEVPQALAAFLYSHSSRRDLDFPEWLHDFKAAQVRDHVLREAPTAKSWLRTIRDPARMFVKQVWTSAAFPNHVDMTRAKALFDGLDTSRGLVLCTFHGAFLFILHDLYRKFMPGHHALTQASIRASNASEEQNDRRSAAFRAVKTLMEKKALLVGPDGPCTEESTSEEITVLGLPLRISFSAAVFAFETRSNSGWISMTYDNERLVPAFLPGPTAKPGESFPKFKDRWLAFYAGRLEAVLSSDPKGLALRAPRWFSFGSNEAR